jgi:hypothetical protein
MQTQPQTSTLLLFADDATTEEQSNANMHELLPVIDGASVIVVIAWHVSIKRAHANTQ